MKNSNSAHDDITIVVENKNSPALKAAIGPGSAFNVFKIISQIEKCKKKGNTLVSEKILKFTHKHQGEHLQIIFKCHQLLNDGWLSLYDSEKSNYIRNEQNELNILDLQTIESGDYELSLVPRERPLSWSLCELLNEMDTRELARPSTFASIIENLEENNSFIDIDPETNDVKLTTEGLRAALLLHELEPLISSSKYTTTLHKAIELVEQGKLTPKIVILMVYEDTFGKEARNLIQDIIWEDIDSIYEDIPESKEENSGVIAIKINPDN